MPSVGTAKLVVRIPEQLRAEVEELVASRNAKTREEPWTLSEFVRIAICEKVALARRRRGARGKGTTPKVVMTDKLQFKRGDGATYDVSI